MTNKYSISSKKLTKSGILLFVSILFISGISTTAFASGRSEEVTMTEEVAEPVVPVSMDGAEEAVLAGGCFWGVEGVFERIDGVLDVVSGYSGGEADTATYHQVGSGNTGHAESVRIMFDPEKVSYRTLLKVFFNVAHDPTELNFQGPDVGTQYRSAIFYTNDEQKKECEEFIRELKSEKVFDKKIVTELAALDTFYPAEEYHQDFMRLNPNHGYIVYWDMPKIINLEKMYPELLAVK